MALNYSVRPMFSPHLPEDNRDGFSRQWQSNRESQDRGDNMDWDTVLPADPFGMDIDMNLGSTVTALTGFLESLDYGPCGRPEVGVSKGDCSFFAELNLLFSKAMDFHPFPGGRRMMDDKVFVADTVDAHLCEELGHPFCDGGLNFVCTMDLNGVSLEHDEMVLADMGGNEYRCNEELGHLFVDDEMLLTDTGFNFVDGLASNSDPDKMLLADTGFNFVDGLASNSDPDKMLLADTGFNFVDGLASNSDDGDVHQALPLALGYLDIQDLLNVERVCKSLRSAIQSDNLPWRSIRIDQPLNDRITDDILIQLTNRAQGSLQCLDMVECQRITEDGLKHVLENNPRLTKLGVAGCTRLSIEGILSCIRAFKSVGIPGLNCLRIGGLYGVTQQHYDELLSLLGIPNYAQANYKKPLYYKSLECYVSCDDDRPIDVEMCPRCQKFRLVYDCRTCGTQCRGCILCIPRCAMCGTCFKEDEYIENFCLELYCVYCWINLGKLQEKQDIQPSSSPRAVAPEPVSSFHG